LVFLLGTLILGAALAPVLFWCSQPLSDMPVLGFLKDTDFSRFFARAILLAAVLLAFPAVRWIGIRRFHDLKIGWAWSRSWQLPAGFLLAGIVIAIWGWFAMKVGLAEFKLRPPWNLVPNLLLTSISVAMIEEWLFRGVIFGLVRQTTPTWLAAIFVSAIFSIIHPLSQGQRALNPSPGIPDSTFCFSRFSI
jgi:membrane protease YdiL (CAAX protease family)